MTIDDFKKVAHQFGLWIAGLLAWTSRLLRHALAFIRPIARLVIIGVLVLVSVPTVEQYWMRRLPAMPDVPISAIVFTSIATVFMMAFAAAAYVFGILLLRAVAVERSYPMALRGLELPKIAGKATHQPTDGSFIPADDEQLWMQEQFDILKKKGILTETDTMDLETMAKEIGLNTILKHRGKTEE